MIRTSLISLALAVSVPAQAGAGLRGAMPRRILCAVQWRVR